MQAEEVLAEATSLHRITVNGKKEGKMGGFSAYFNTRAEGNLMAYVRIAVATRET